MDPVKESFKTIFQLFETFPLQEIPPEKDSFSMTLTILCASYMRWMPANELPRGKSGNQYRKSREEIPCSRSLQVHCKTQSDGGKSYTRNLKLNEELKREFDRGILQ